MKPLLCEKCDECGIGRPASAECPETRGSVAFASAGADHAAILCAKGGTLRDATTAGPCVALHANRSRGNAIPAPMSGGGMARRLDASRLLTEVDRLASVLLDRNDPAGTYTGTGLSAVTRCVVVRHTGLGSLQRVRVVGV